MSLLIEKKQFLTKRNIAELATNFPNRCCLKIFEISNLFANVGAKIPTTVREPLTTKEAREVAAALEWIYSRSLLSWPKLLQVDPNREFMGTVNQLLSKHNVEVRRGRLDIHRDQAIVERFNRTLTERLFGHQIYGVEMRLPDNKRLTEWVTQMKICKACFKISKSAAKF